MSSVGKRIVQTTFDDVVRENIEDLEMDPPEAIADAIEQFTAQGVVLNNIVTDLVVTSDGSSWHPILNVTDNLKTIDVVDRSNLCDQLSALKKECEKSLAHRVLAVKEQGCFLVLLDIYDKLCTVGDDASMTVLLSTWCALLNGQPDCVYDRVADIFMDLTKSKVKNICLFGVRLIITSCIMHEGNRQSFIAKDVVKRIAEVLRDHKQHGDVVTEACVLVRTLTLDDDPRVPFSKAHDHAKMIVTEANALDLLLEIAKSYSDEAVLGEIFATLGRLAVRNEFCQRIADLGGLQLMLTVMKENLDNKDICSKIVGVFKAIAGNDDVKVALAKSETPSVIVEAIDRHQRSEALCTNACACLATICLRNQDNVRKVMACLGHCAIVQCMKIHPTSITVQKQACMAIRNLVARSKDNCGLILALGAEELVNRAMTLNSVNDEAKGALRDLGCKIELTERWTGEKGSISQ